MSTLIRRAEEFKRDSRKGFGHYSSGALDTVIDILRLYHNNTGNHAVRDHILMELRDAVNGWAKKHPKEFAARHGPDLQREVAAELEQRCPELLKLEDGDILFRWVPRGIGQRGPGQGIISGAQLTQDATYRSVFAEGLNLDDSAFLVQHVGIHVRGEVIEIGRWGLERNPVSGREHYDLVVRSRQYGMRIAEKARTSTTGPSYHTRLGMLMMYPVWDLPIVALLPRTGGRWPDEAGLHGKDQEYQRNRCGNVLQQRVICSHFVNAVLYAAVRPQGTVAAATDHDFDRIFKISPAQMWNEFMNKQGIWAQLGAVFAGVQHKGKLDRNITPSSLNVGLTRPPIPKKAGRPSLHR